MTTPMDTERRIQPSVVSFQLSSGVELRGLSWQPPEDFDGVLLPPCLLVHGLASNARLWDGVAWRLAQAGHPVVAIDQRGHGHSSKPDSGYEMATVADDLALLIDAMQWKQPLVAGQSWGANVVIELGYRHPSSARAIACVDGGFIELKQRFPNWEDAQEVMAPPKMPTPTQIGPRKAVKVNLRTLRFALTAPSPRGSPLNATCKCFTACGNTLPLPVMHRSIRLYCGFLPTPVRWIGPIQKRTQFSRPLPLLRTLELSGSALLIMMCTLSTRVTWHYFCTEPQPNPTGSPHDRNANNPGTTPSPTCHHGLGRNRTDHGVDPPSPHFVVANTRAGSSARHAVRISIECRRTHPARRGIFCYERECAVAGGRAHPLASIRRHGA